jgi:osmotically inducible protein OsmC
MITRDARAIWNETLKEGSGTVRFGGHDEAYSFASRFERGAGTSPEELIAAAHAGCYAMALALVLEQHGHRPETIRTSARVSLDAAHLSITTVELDTEARVPGLDEAAFREIAEEAKRVCPVSKALAGAEVVLGAAHLASAEAA